MTSSSEREALVWDLPTRVFHWSLVILVGINLFLISPRGGLHTIVHFVAGYGVAGLLLFRVGWGFIGSPRSRFSDFLCRWPAVKAYADRLMRLDPPQSVGHNPLGGWMIALLLALHGGMVATGLLAAGRRAAGPLAGLIPVPAASLLSSLHSLISDLLIALVVVHVAGVAVDWFLTGDNLVKAMLTGCKRLPTAAATGEGRTAPLWRAAILAVLALALVAGLALSTDYTLTRSSLAQIAGQP